MSQEVVAIDLSEMHPAGAFELVLSPKQNKTWNFTNKEGKSVNGRKDWVSLQVKTRATNTVGDFFLTIPALKTFKGIQISQYDTTFISVVPLPGYEETLNNVRSFIDARIYELLFTRKFELLNNADRFNSPSEISFVLPNGVVKRGELKKDQNDPLARYSDSMIFGIPSKKVSSGVVVDQTLCQITNTAGDPFSWDQLNGKELDEITISVNITLGTKMDVTCTARSIVARGSSTPMVVSQSRLKRRQQEAQQNAMLAAQKAAGVQPPAPSDQTTASQAPTAPSLTMSGTHDLFGDSPAKRHAPALF